MSNIRRELDLEMQKEALETETCSICLDEFHDIAPETFFQGARCVHAYHLDCISKWVYTCNDIACPICKTSFLEDGDHASPMQKLLRHSRLAL